MSEGRRIAVRGTVQGVGFRPWVWRLARDVGVGGRIRNDPLGVTIEAFGGGDALDDFVARLASEAPAPARVYELRAESIPAEPVVEFVIDASAAGGARALSIPADLATCDACAAEVSDPGDRRAGYPFTNCTHCGPRFTIATDIPYDRPATTMAEFVMCPACQREYDDPADRRFHAQPNACPACGPRLALLDANGDLMIEVVDAIAEVARRIRGGAIAAVKGLGGFHLACAAGDQDAVVALRERKGRDQKPFAVMAGDLAGARRLADLTAVEEALLTSPERPIVLCRRRPGAPLAPAIAPDTDLVGVMLPYTPLHRLLLAAAGGPLVMTSGNRSDEPICRTTAEAIDRLDGIADVFLTHDREIAARCDDSVAQVVAGAPMVLRRSRGFVPRPVPLLDPVAAPVLAVGAHLKNTFCVAVGDRAYLGPHVGDLDTPEAADQLAASIDRMCRLLEVEPEIVACDLHPDYASSRLARELAAEPIAVQHHHAHVASAIAEHRLAGPIIGVAYDGTGLGTDGTSWGGEIMVADVTGFVRCATFRPIPLAGGDAAIREVWRIAVALVDDAFDGAPLVDHAELLPGVAATSIAAIRSMIAADFNCPQARGVGRYFDGLGALGLGRAGAAFEGQVAVAWNRCADPRERRAYPYSIDRDRDVAEIDLRPMVRAAVADIVAGADAGAISARFHETLAAATAQVIGGLERLPVVLTGGVFANARLAESLIAALPGRDVLLHREVPPGDGGLALGQAVVAARKGAR